ncbi:NAD(P)/FAD-dependent oxidoreductase [Candidatus Amarolinea aalborgensis]|uniref:NAD(P)/FAD-dependent oxidoreductase n=1 Tax=Candidatus Amarolinea aalborgensis TaxID=2249329 RepID=UPI003BFA2B55
MANLQADVVICGAGIAGIATAFYLATRYGVRRVILVDERPPLSLTSDKSTECYRNWWPGPGDAMVSLMNHSIDLLEMLARETANAFHLNRRGYIYATADLAQIERLAQAAAESATFGAGPVRLHGPGGGRSAYQPAPAAGFEDQPSGADLITDPMLLQEHFPYLAPNVVAVLHARRCGWFSAQLLGMLMLEQARALGVRLLSGHVAAVELRAGRVSGVHIQQAQSATLIETPVFVNAAGPFLDGVARQLGVTLPIHHERHLKMAFHDHRGVVPRHAPFLVWADAQRLPWDDEERAWLAASAETQWMLDEFTPGVHTRPDGPADSPILLMLWDYHARPVEMVLPAPLDAEFPDLVLRGLSTMLPGLRAYFGRAPKPSLDGGYYTKTQENRPLIGPLGAPGAYVIGALSGYGVMAAPGAGDLLARQISGQPLPNHARWFLPSRYEDPAYQSLLANWGATGQL